MQNKDLKLSEIIKKRNPVNGWGLLKTFVSFSFQPALTCEQHYVNSICTFAKAEKISRSNFYEVKLKLDLLFFS